MKIAYNPDDGTLILADVGINYQPLKSVSNLRWNKQRKTLEGRANLDTLNRLASIAHLPPNVERARRIMKLSQDAIDAERNKPEPVPVIEPPVKKKLFAHQARAYNMALLAFGLVEPKEVEQ